MKPNTTFNTRTVIDSPPPIYKVVKQETHETGLFRRYETRIVIDGPMVLGRVGLQYENNEASPIFLSFDTVTEEIIDGKLYTVLIRESYEEVYQND
jgi:hypothetical protein